MSKKPKSPKPAVPAKPLHLNLHKQFFDAIAEGRKKTEYRDNTPFWRPRLDGRSYDEIEFRNGFGPRVPRMRVKCRGIRKEGRTSFAIDLGRIVEIENWSKPMKPAKRHPGKTRGS